MYSGKTVFLQIMNCLPMDEFRKCVDRYQGNLASYHRRKPGEGFYDYRVEKQSQANSNGKMNLAFNRFTKFLFLERRN